MSEHRAGLETGNARVDPARIWGRPPLCGLQNVSSTQSRRGSGDSMLACGDVTERFVVVMTLGNASRAKGPQFKVNARRSMVQGDWR